VKTSLSPGSRVVADYLARSGLQDDLDALGFQVTGFGCMTCMGNSGPLADSVLAAIDDAKLATVAVLSGNRNFDARIHPSVRASFAATGRRLRDRRYPHPGPHARTARHGPGRTSGVPARDLAGCG
jgi:aconitase A